MDLYTFENYKQLLRARVKEDSALTLKRIAEKIQIQYTYLSRVLNDDKAHLSEDHLFAICNLLKMVPDEIDFVFLLRSIEVSSDLKRQEFLRNKLNAYRRKKHLDVPLKEFEGRLAKDEVDYLFDPFCVIVHVALFIPEYREHPRRLCSLLGLSPERLELCLKKLRDLGFVQKSETSGQLEVTKRKIHYGTDHPLMRAHQQLMRTASQAQLVKALEADKHSFVTTFAADAAVVNTVYEKFQEFLAEVETLASRSPARGLYQMQFDLFKWF